MAAQTVVTDAETTHFKGILSQEPFTGLRAILETLSSDYGELRQAVDGGNSYQGLLARLGYGLILIKQIHVQDAYTRVGPAGGIKTVLPYYDIPTQASFPTLINFDATVSTTPKAAEFFNAMLTALKTQLKSQK
jgi:hypothetical protein